MGMPSDDRCTSISMKRAPSSMAERSAARLFSGKSRAFPRRATICNSRKAFMQTETASVHVPCAIAVGIASDDRTPIIAAVRHVASDVGHGCDAVDVQQLALKPVGVECCSAHT